MMANNVQQINQLKPIEEYLGKSKSSLNNNNYSNNNNSNATNSIVYSNSTDNGQDNFNALNLVNTYPSINQNFYTSNGRLSTNFQQGELPHSILVTESQQTLSSNHGQNLYRYSLPSIYEFQFQQMNDSPPIYQRTQSFISLPTINSTASFVPHRNSISILPVFSCPSYSSIQTGNSAMSLTQPLHQQIPVQLQTVPLQHVTLPKISYSFPQSHLTENTVNNIGTNKVNTSINIPIENNIPRTNLFNENSFTERNVNKGSSIPHINTTTSSSIDNSNLTVHSIINSTDTYTVSNMRSNGTLTPISTSDNHSPGIASANTDQEPSTVGKPCNKKSFATSISSLINLSSNSETKRNDSLLSPSLSENDSSETNELTKKEVSSITLDSSNSTDSIESLDSDISNNEIFTPVFTKIGNTSTNIIRKGMNKNELLRELDESLKLRCNSGDNEYNCKLCNKQFRRAAWLKRHIVTHTTERPFKCVWCTSKHKRRDNLFKHMRLKHMDLLMSSIKDFYPLVEFDCNDKLQDLIKSGKLHKEDVKRVLLSVINE